MRKHRRRNKKQRNIIIISACSLLLIMTVGYAAMSTNLEINAKGNVLKNASLGEDLVENVGTVTNGDGLYKDAYEENVYTYRGSNPNNYVNFNNELWRIISVNTNDNTIKIIRNEILENRAFDKGERYQGSNGYCNHLSWGCNIWGSINTLYDNTGLNKITSLAGEVNGTKYTLPNTEADLNIYLNQNYYNVLQSDAKSMITEGTYKVGVLNSMLNKTLASDIEQVKQVIWKGKIALLDITEYIRGSINPVCDSTYDYFSGPYVGECNENGQNWLDNNEIFLSLSPYSSNAGTSTIYYTNSNGTVNASSSNAVRPVVTLKPEVQITSGDGTQNNAYNLELK